MPKNPVKRQVSRKTFDIRGKFPGLEYDDSNAMDIAVIRERIEDCNQSGIPTILTIRFFYIKNTFLELQIPILPVCYNLDKPEDVMDFVKYGTEAEAKALLESTPAKLVEEKSVYYTKRIMNYICHELAKKYVLTQNETASSGKPPLLDKIENLQIMQDFDLNPGNKPTENGVGASAMTIKKFELPVTDYKNQINVCLIGLKKKAEGGRVVASEDYDDYSNVEFTNTLNYLNDMLYQYEHTKPQFRPSSGLGD